MAANITPPEVLEQICQQLASEDLKQARLICRSFNLVARRYLFKEVLVRCNLESFRRLSYVARDVTLKRFVRKVYVDHSLLTSQFLNLREWSEKGIDLLKRIGLDGKNNAKGVDEFRDQLMPVELEYHYAQYRYFVDSQRCVLSENRCGKWLPDSLKSFQNLEFIKFGPHHREKPPEQRKSTAMSLKSLSSIGRLTLIEPKIPASFSQKAHIFLAIINAAQKCEGRVKSISASSIPWETFSEQVHTPSSPTSRIRHLYLSLAFDVPAKATYTREYDNLAHFVATAMMLQTMHLAFEPPARNHLVNLADILTHRLHWPSLQDIRLENLAASSAQLYDFLGTHATTLRKLGFRDISLISPPDAITAGSWKSLILFLQQHLRLQEVQLGGRLWSATDSWEARWGPLSTSPPPPGWEATASRAGCLQDRVHAFIIGGGECPLDLEALCTYGAGDRSFSRLGPRSGPVGLI